MLKLLGASIKSGFYKNSFPLVNEVNGSRRITLILGWAGSSQTHNYNKLLRHYETKGVTTVLHVMPLLCPKFIRSSFESDIEQTVLSLRNVRTQANNEATTFDIHLFSHNGCWTFSSLLKRGILPNPRKVLIDSAPNFLYDRNATAEADVISQLLTTVVTGRAQYHQFPFTPITRAILYATMSLSALTDKWIPSKYEYFTDYAGTQRYMRDNHPIVPTMFLCSEGDKFMPVKEVRRYRECIESRGIPTEERVFGEEVSHISTMYRHPNEYMEIVDEWFEL